MMPDWVALYVGIPYVDHGAHAQGADCWGLYRLIQSEQFGRQVPEIAYLSADDVHEVQGHIKREQGHSRWVEVSSPVVGDLVLLRIAGHPVHLGCVVDEGTMIHTLKGHAAAIESYQGPKWQKRVAGFYRWH
jgi:cell wall-associated NlpC family hydrolase